MLFRSLPNAWNTIFTISSGKFSDDWKMRKGETVIKWRVKFSTRLCDYLRSVYLLHGNVRARGYWKEEVVINDILDMASYNGQNYTPCDHCFKNKWWKISIWLKKTFTESYWLMTKCWCQCCDLGYCQNYDHIRMADWKTKDRSADVSLWSPWSLY